MLKWTLLAGLISAATIVSSPTAAQAVSIIQYQLSGTATGEVDGTAFTDAPFTLELTANADNLISFDSLKFTQLGELSVEITGVDSGETTGVYGFGANPTEGIIGIVDPTITQGITGNSDELEDYDLSSILESTPIEFRFLEFSDQATDFGELTFSSVENLTFSAAAIPEPVTVFGSLMAIGMGAVLKKKSNKRK